MLFVKIILYASGFQSLLASKLKNRQTTVRISEPHKCEELCLQCSFENNTICEVCKPGIYFYENRCYTKCPDRTYSDQEWQVCRACDSTCPVCWGSRPDMCGTTAGVKTQMMLLENEVKQYFTNKPFESSRVLDWLHNLNVILKDVNYSEKIDILDSEDTIATNVVYNSDKIVVDLPVGSFSRNDGVFVPVPSYINSKMELVKFHWIYIKGQWNGYTWNDSWFPLIPSFIKSFGDRGKMYYENGGYWIYDKPSNSKIINNYIDWVWKKSDNILLNNEKQLTNSELTSDLNSINFDQLDLNNKFLNEKITSKKQEIRNNLKSFYEIFKNNNKMTFSKLKDTINQEQNTLINNLSALKNKVEGYLREEEILNNEANKLITS
jgi:hypothetical protein